jgi:hypothetical protein
MMGVAGLLVLAAGTAASGQVSGKRVTARFTPVPVAVPAVGSLAVSRLGVLPPGGPGGADACETVATHTDASFTGGSYIIQQGFSEGEWEVCTYTLPASAFPIKFKQLEAIFAQQTSVNTETQWSVAVWQGVPNSGVQLLLESSDDLVLPHLRIPAGTNGVNLAFAIDASEPQLIISDDGTHRFSVGYRIDRHNSPPPPCGTPAGNANAFPATDTSGLSQPAGNWLFAITCPLACPGGWSTFGNLLSVCRPSGDWVMRATWESVNCTAGVGACCLPNGTCQVISQSVCATSNGVYRGDGVECANANCAEPTGACCFSGNCLNLTSGDCTSAGGVWQGAGSACATGNICPLGACCLPNGTCITDVTSGQCTGQGGTFRGVGSTCATSCPQPTGACCLSSGGCLLLTQVDCGIIPNSSWAGALTTCGGSTCQPCYANCDGSTAQPILNVNDFVCFQGRFAAADTRANCDESTNVPVLNINDFICFQAKFAAGCP